MKSSAKHSLVGNSREISGHVLTLHQRLYHSLNLGSWENREKWHCSDIEIQKLVIRSMDVFLDSMCSEILQHPLVKDSMIDMVRALESILEFKSQPVLRLASNAAAKMVNLLPSSMLQSYVLDLIYPLANLLSSQQLQVSMSCATAINSIVSKLSSRNESKVLQILKATKAVTYIVQNINGFCVDVKPSEYFQEMSSVLAKILWRWPPFRFCVWNDSKFLNVLDTIKLVSEIWAKVGVLQLYYSLALCHNGAEKLLENGEPLLRFMVGCMDCSNIPSVSIEAFKLARCFGLSERGCVKMINICGEPLVKSVISAVQNWNSLSEQLAKSQIPAVKEACHLAFITRWAGHHHKYFWQSGVERILLDLLLEDYHKIHKLKLELSLNDLVLTIRERFCSKFNMSLKPYAWEIFGGLAANCGENLINEFHEKEFELNALIICACLTLIDSIGTSHHIFENSATNMIQGESAARAVLMVVYSPCKYIASMGRSIICKTFKPNCEDYLEYLLKTLKSSLSGNRFGIPGNLQLVVSLMSLVCHSVLPKYQKLVIKCRGVETLIAFVRWWLKNPVYMKRASMMPHLHDLFSEKICCFPCVEEWEGKDILLFYSLQILSELLSHSAPQIIHPPSNQAEFADDQLVQELQKVCGDCTFSPGSRWHAAYVLCYFGLYGFPSKLGKRIGKALGNNEHADLKFHLVNQEVVYVHEVILMARCPSLLPPRELVPEEMLSIAPNVNHDFRRSPFNLVQLSRHVDMPSLLKLLEFVYMGYLQASDNLVKKLKILAKHCNLEALFKMLCRIVPKWGTPIPRFDLTPVLHSAGLHSSDLLLEAKTNQLEHWKCKFCSALVPHIHVHKIILESSCSYLQALFRSGMQESHLQTVKVPVSWESLNKIVIWFYSAQFPVSSFDCSWDNMDPEEKFQVIQSYLEVCWLAEFWIIEDLYEECYKAVLSCFNSSTYLPAKTIQIAADFSQWKLAQVAANYMARSYHHLRDSGELDDLDERLVEMVRTASVQHSQEDFPHFSGMGASS